MNKPLKNGLTFLLYLILYSLFLFNHQGGADIITMFLMTITIFIHFIVLISLIIKWRLVRPIMIQYFYSLIVIIILAILFNLLIDKYFELMWNITS